MDISRFLDFKNRWQLVKDTILWLICGLILLIAGNLLESKLSLKIPYIIHSPEPIRIAAFFLFLILLFMLFRDLFRWIKVRWWVFWNRNRPYIFNDKDWSTKWISNGKTEISDEGYLFVKSSRAGCLLKDSYWKDFKMSFEAKFKSDDKGGDEKRFGLIFRAEDLDNYFMIEIGENEEKYKKPEEGNGSEKEITKKIPSSIKPHVRYRGIWEIMSAIEIKTEEPFNFSDFVKVSLEVKGDTARFFYKDTPIFKWVLPICVDVNHAESGVEKKEEKVILAGAFTGHVQKIPFRLGYGLVGLGSHWSHAGVYIRNLRVEPLTS